MILNQKSFWVYLSFIFETWNEIINKAGGIHKFINFDKPILTDNGGYQVTLFQK